jgi:hypothetical protein
MCKENWYWDKAKGVCQDCGDDSLQQAMTVLKSPPLIAMYVFAFMLMGLAYFRTAMIKKFDVDGDGDVDMDDIRLGLKQNFPILYLLFEATVMSSKVRILVTLYQIISPMGFNLGVRFPDAFTEVLSALDFINLDILPYINLACTLESNAINMMYINTLYPLVFIILLFLVRKYNLILFLTFLIFLSTCRVIFTFFKCDYFVDLDVWYLESDYSINCDSARYKQGVLYAASMAVVYAFGIPMMYFVLVYQRRSILSIDQNQRTEDEQAKTAHLGFLTTSYKPKLWYFECIECVRRLLLSSFLVLISPGSSAQGLVALLMALASLRLYVGLRQYPNATDNKLAEIAQWQLIFTFLAALLIKIDVSSNITEYDGYLFDYLLIAIIFAGPAISFLSPVMPYLAGKPLKIPSLKDAFIPAAVSEEEKELERIEKAKHDLRQKTLKKERWQCIVKWFEDTPNAQELLFGLFETMKEEEKQRLIKLKEKKKTKKERKADKKRESSMQSSDNVTTSKDDVGAVEEASPENESIDIEELMLRLREIGVKGMTVEKVNALYFDCDQNGDGMSTLGEITQAFCEASPAIAEAMLKKFDADGDGDVDMDDLLGLNSDNKPPKPPGAPGAPVAPAAQAAPKAAAPVAQAAPKAAAPKAAAPKAAAPSTGGAGAKAPAVGGAGAKAPAVKKRPSMGYPPEPKQTKPPGTNRQLAKTQSIEQGAPGSKDKDKAHLFDSASKPRGLSLDETPQGIANIPPGEGSHGNSRSASKSPGNTRSATNAPTHGVSHGVVRGKTSTPNVNRTADRSGPQGAKNPSPRSTTETPNSERPTVKKQLPQQQGPPNENKSADDVEFQGL